MEKLPKILSVRAAPNFPDNLEVTVQWGGEYMTMLTFHRTDFDGDAAPAKKIISEHVVMIKRKLDLAEFIIAIRQHEEEMKLKLLKLKLEYDEKRCLEQQKTSS